ncbi:hypothetical protein GIB67_007127 [Kingdonia uniflora]|uniref:Uncharacterized protein n=1 Tax=Kingdonia uniflora TaxID=39325 RepID=A0A7J7MLP5_9MAGN|nr:hypothetical protein GIB67_007127 [Kingdonia uniflora]
MCFLDIGISDDDDKTGARDSKPNSNELTSAINDGLYCYELVDEIPTELRARQSNNKRSSTALGSRDGDPRSPTLAHSFPNPKSSLSSEGEERPTMKEVVMELEGLRKFEKHLLVLHRNEESISLLSEPEEIYSIELSSYTDTVAFAVVWEAARRKLGMHHFDVQEFRKLALEDAAADYNCGTECQFQF